MPPLLFADSLHLGESVPPALALVSYLTLYGIRARTLAREQRPVPT